MHAIIISSCFLFDAGSVSCIIVIHIKQIFGKQNKAWVHSSDWRMFKHTRVWGETTQKQVH